MQESKARVLAIEAGRTLLIDKDEFLRSADSAGICILAI
jgi:DUF1009 family protein